MVYSIGDPGPEVVHAEECLLLTKVVELGVAIKQAGGDELVKYTHGERRKNCEEHVPEGLSPRFVNDFARERILE